MSDLWVATYIRITDYTTTVWLLKSAQVCWLGNNFYLLLHKSCQVLAAVFKWTVLFARVCLHSAQQWLRQSNVWHGGTSLKAKTNSGGVWCIHPDWRRKETGPRKSSQKCWKKQKEERKVKGEETGGKEKLWTTLEPNNERDVRAVGKSQVLSLINLNRINFTLSSQHFWLVWLYMTTHSAPYYLSSFWQSHLEHLPSWKFCVSSSSFECPADASIQSARSGARIVCVLLYEDVSCHSSNL